MGYKHDFVEDNPYLVYTDEPEKELPAEDDGDDDDDGE